MAYDKVVDSAVLDAGLTSIADEIRAKGGTTDTMSFPDGMVNAIAAIETGGSSVSTWKNVQQIVQRGDGAKVFPVGTQFQVSTQSYGTLLFDVVAHDHHKNPNDETAHTMTLLMHDVLPDMEFDAAELLWVNTTGAELAAGTYKINTYNSFPSSDGSSSTEGSYYFTTTKPIPVNGGIRGRSIGADFNSTGSAGFTSFIYTYDADLNKIESLTFWKGTPSSIDAFLGIACRTKVNNNGIGTWNSSVANYYGSPNWKYSNIRQWLNSSGAANEWWSKQTIFDLPPTYANMPGFLRDIDSEFVEVIGEVDVSTKYSTKYEVDGILTGYYTVRDKMFLVSRAEIGHDSSYTCCADTDSTLDYFSGSSASDLLKYKYNDTSTAYSWWLRNSNNEWNGYCVYYNSNFVAGYSSNTNIGVAAACVIY